MAAGEIIVCRTADGDLIQYLQLPITTDVLSTER